MVKVVKLLMVIGHMVIKILCLGGGGGREYWVVCSLCEKERAGDETEATMCVCSCVAF